MKKILTPLFLLALVQSSFAAAFDYQLSERVKKVAPDTYVVEGDDEHFSIANGGNVLNTGFIVTEAGVLVIDTGPSLQYGQQLRSLIESITDQPIVKVVNTHHHPDHFFGNQAFTDKKIVATASTRTQMSAYAGGYSDAMYRLVGRAMFGTDYVLPNETASDSKLELGKHQVELIELSGHTDSELVVFDRTTGVLFAGDLVFNHRAPTTPHADIDDWLNTLVRLGAFDFTVLVPGHGHVSNDKESIAETARYLDWLQSSLGAVANAGATAAEALQQSLPDAFKEWGAMPSEYQRSVHHLFPALEEASFYAPITMERH